MMNYNRGTVWWIDLPMKMHSHVQGGARPCLIVSNHLDRSGVVTVCPLSTKIDSIKTHPRVFVKKEGQVLIEQITTVDISSIGDYVGELNPVDMNAVDEAITSHLLGSRVEKRPVVAQPDSTMKLNFIEKKLDKVLEMMEYILWRDKRDSNGKNVRNF